MTTAAERRKDARRLRAADRKIERQAEHDEKHHAEISDPQVRCVAWAICTCVYRATGCACKKRPDMTTCSTMTSAALIARDIYRRS